MNWRFDNGCEHNIVAAYYFMENKKRRDYLFCNICYAVGNSAVKFNSKSIYVDREEVREKYYYFKNKAKEGFNGYSYSVYEQNTLFKSKLEAKWAQYFTDNGYKWKYEPFRINLNNEDIYIPDFQIDKNYLVEIKPVKCWDERWLQVEDLIIYFGTPENYDTLFINSITTKDLIEYRKIGKINYF